MTELQYRIYKIYVRIAAFAVILSLPSAFVLPVEWSFENGLLENFQVIVLIIETALILCLRLNAKWLQRFFAAGFILIALRELSWGRVFFPTGMEEFGAVFVSMADYEYRLHVYVFLTIYIAAMLFVLIRFVPVKKILFGRQPLAAFAVILIAHTLNYIGDHGLIIGKAYGQVLEELNELILYMTLPAVALYWLWQLKENPSK